MAAKTERELAADLKRGRLEPVYLFYGEEAYLTRLYTERIHRRAVTDLPELNLHVFDGSARLDEIAVAADALPVMSERSCVILRDYAFSGASDAEFAQFLELLTSPNESCILILTYSTADIGKGKRAKELMDAAGKSGCVLRFDRKNERELADLASKRAAKALVVLNPDVARRLVDRCGTDLENLLTEVDKLCAYVGDRAVTAEDVDAVTTRTVEASAFALATAVCSKRRDEAMAICRDLFDLRTEPVMILGALSSVFLDVYRVKLGQSSGLGTEQIAEEFGYGKAVFKLRNAASNGRNMTVESAYEALEILRQADLALKSSSMDGRVVIERAVVRLLKVAAGEDA